MSEKYPGRTWPLDITAEQAVFADRVINDPNPDINLMF